MYAKADLLSFQHQYAKALATYDSILVYYPNAPLADDILYAKANIWIKEQSFEKAIEALSEIGVKYGEDIYGDDALYTKANLYDFTLNDQKQAMELYSDLFMKYPGSTYVVKAKKRYRQLRGDKIEEIKND
jgi:tetratricopeptide (TPR) repeat protein